VIRKSMQAAVLAGPLLLARAPVGRAAGTAPDYGAELPQSEQEDVGHPVTGSPDDDAIALSNAKARKPARRCVHKLEELAANSMASGSPSSRSARVPWRHAGAFQDRACVAARAPGPGHRARSSQRGPRVLPA
jgi:hypothetical protein